LISTVVMFQAQNRETINSRPYLKSCRVLPDHYDDERNETVFHNTTQHQIDLQDQDQDRFFLFWDRSCRKTDGLRPHHCSTYTAEWTFSSVKLRTTSATPWQMSD